MSDADVENATLQICRIGESVGLILPEALLTRPNLKEATNNIRLSSRMAAFT